MRLAHNTRELLNKIISFGRCRPNIFTASVLILTLCIIYFPVMAGLRTINPAFYYSGLPQIGRPGIAPFLDPNVGFQGQALGLLSLKDIVHGLLPQWNPFEGMGTPLLGNMQSGPLNILQVPFEGTYFLWVIAFLGHLWISGFFTVLFVRRKGISMPIALLAGIAYMLAGSNIWWGGPPPGAVAPLFPLLMYSVDLVVEQCTFKSVGWLSICTFLAIAAGFPEMTFLSIGSAYAYGLFAAISNRRVLRSILAGTLGGFVGLILSLPILSAFLDALRVSSVVNGPTLGMNHLSMHWFLSLVMPYGFGLVQFPWNSQLSNFWGNVGGFVTPFVILGALLNLVGLNRKAETWFWAVLSGVLIAKTFGGINFLGRLPLFDRTATYRYSDPIWEFGLIIMMTFAIDHISRIRFRHFLGATALYIGLVAFGFYEALPIILNSGTVFSHFVEDMAFELLSLITVVLSYSWARSRKHMFLIGAFVSGVYAFLPIAFAGSGTVSTAIPTFLQSKYSLHWGRMATLGPLAPNFSSFYDVPTVNVNDAMMPVRYANFVNKYFLNNGKDSLPELFVGYNIYTGDPLSVQPRLTYYQDLGVRWIVAPSSMNLVQAESIVETPIPGNIPMPITDPAKTYTVMFDSPFQSINGFSLLFGTYNHPVKGHMFWTITQQHRVIGRGTYSLSMVKNNDPTIIGFPSSPVTLNSPLKLTLKLSIVAGRLALWYNKNSGDQFKVYHDARPLSGVVYLGIYHQVNSPAELDLITSRRGISVWKLSHSMPQVWIPNHFVASSEHDQKELSALFALGPAALKNTASVNIQYIHELRRFSTDAPSGLKATVASSSINGHLIVHTRDAHRTIIVLNQVYNRFWEARDHGRRLSTFPIDGLYEGFIAPKGAQTVVVEYSPPLQNTELAISGVTMLFVLVGIYETSRRPRRGSLS